MPTKDEIRAAMLGNHALRTEPVYVDRLGIDLHIRELTGAELDAFQEAIRERRTGDSINLKGLKAGLVALSLVDESGVRVFDDDEGETLNESLPSAVIKQLYDVAARINGMDEAEAKELLGNSEAAPTDASGSD